MSMNLQSILIRSARPDTVAPLIITALAVTFLTPSAAYAGSFFRYSEFDLPGASAYGAAPYGLNDLGQVTGALDSSGFVKTGDTIMTFAVPGGQGGGLSINDAGQVVGNAFL